MSPSRRRFGAPLQHADLPLPSRQRRASAMLARPTGDSPDSLSRLAATLACCAAMPAMMRAARRRHAGLISPPAYALADGRRPPARSARATRARRAARNMAPTAQHGAAGHLRAAEAATALATAARIA